MLSNNSLIVATVPKHITKAICGFKAVTFQRLYVPFGTFSVSTPASLFNYRLVSWETESDSPPSV